MMDNREIAHMVYMSACLWIAQELFLADDSKARKTEEQAERPAHLK
jgi:DNA/RNA endonuclease YhcR with UshA esterase domain